MCGISVLVNGTSDEIKAMGEAIKHRGVTHNVTEVDNVKVWFSYLPITDNSAPMQPFQSGEFMVWMNGFISNYKELSVKYQINLSTNCDTELLAKFIHAKNRLSELNGFFSVVVYNTKTKILTTFTDRYGCKQLYRYTHGVKKYISSEVKSLQAVLPLEISSSGVDDWIYSLGVMNDETIYKDVQRIACLPFPQVKTKGITYQKAKERLSFLLDQSITRNKVYGLKDGVFLSGGVDSGILARKLNPDYCFSVDYLDENFSETKNIKLNSSGIHYGIICNERLLTDYKYKTLVALDDLKAGSSYTNFALTEMASKFCTVLYSGAGGDEVFDGYTHRYNRNIKDVIRRTDTKCKNIYPEITHKEYDWKFLKAVLVVEDRMSGFHTMETRYPLLDNDFVDFALSLPAEYRKNKKILKDISGLSPEVTNAPKKGFSNPYMSNIEWATFALSLKS